MKKKNSLLEIAIACFILLAGGFSGADAATVLGNVLCLGDSITQGWTTPGGYRDPLYTKLTNAGYTANFIGTQFNNSSSALITSGQYHHEGRGGWCIAGQAPEDPSPTRPRNGLAENLPSFFASYGSAQPDYILLHIGTNDMVYPYYPETAASRLASLISMISDKNTGLAPNAHLIVAQIIPVTNNNGINNNINVYNAAMIDIVAAAQARGENVTMVDMHSALNTSIDYYDAVHPDASGFEKMADVWFDGIMAVPEPHTNALLLMSGILGGLAFWRSRRIRD